MIHGASAPGTGAASFAVGAVLPLSVTALAPAQGMIPWGVGAARCTRVMPAR
jgi:hypothetical protein